MVTDSNEQSHGQTVTVSTPEPLHAVEWYASVLGWRREPGSTDVLILDNDERLKFVSGFPSQTPIRLKTSRILEQLISLKQEAAEVGKLQPLADGMLELAFTDPYDQRILLWQDTSEHPVRGVCRIKR